LFSIRFHKSDSNEAEGIITLGSHWETFFSSHGLWECEEYRREWRNALLRVLSFKPAALVTDMVPVAGNILTWWPMWREADCVVLQNHLFFYDQHGVSGDLLIEQLYDLIGPRRAVSEEGTQISEWTVLVSEIESFLTQE
jgi:hypothetical protein